MQEFIFKQLDDGTYGAMSYEGDETEVTVPAVYGGKPVTLIYDEIFKGHSEIEKVNLPDSLTNIGSFAFEGCEQLKTVVLPKGLQEMWQYAFARSGIELIDIPGSVRSIVPFTFQECKNLRLVVCHEGTGRINAWAFRDCTNLEMVAVHSSTEIRHNAFEGCIRINPDVRTKMTATCQCPQCTGGKKIDVMSMLKK